MSGSSMSGSSSSEVRVRRPAGAAPVGQAKASSSRARIEANDRRAAFGS